MTKNFVQVEITGLKIELCNFFINNFVAQAITEKGDNTTVRN